MKIFLIFLAFIPIGISAEDYLKAEEELPIDSFKTVKLQEVQVLSLRANKNTPVAYSFVDKKDIEEVNFGKDVPMLLLLTPSVTATSDAGNGIGYTSIRIRGTDPTRINITANGIPINDSESNNVYWTNMADFSSSVENIQIQRGVGTSTNGSGAFGASINMQTENIYQKPSIGVDLSAGSYSSHKETLKFSTGIIKDHWGLQGRLSDIGSNGYIDRASSRLGSYFLQAGYFSNSTQVKFVTFNGKEKTYDAWNYPSLEELKENGRRYNSCGYMYTDDEGKDYFYKNQIDLYHQQHYQLLFTEILPKDFSLNIGVHYTRGDGYYEEYKRKRSLIEYNLSKDETLTSDLVRRKLMGNNFYGAIASISYDLKDKLKATLGGGWNKYDGDHWGEVLWVKTPDETYYPEDEYYNNKARKVDFNIYGKLTYEFLAHLNAYIDLQYRHVGYKMYGTSDEFSYEKMSLEEFNVNDKFDFFNPKVGLYYKIAKFHELYASFAVSHKEPTRNDYEDNLNSSLKAERLFDWEAGYKFSLSRFSLCVNLYLMNYLNQFVITGEKDQIGDMIARNVGKSYRMGIEFEGAWKPVDFFSWNLNFTLSHNRAKDWHIQDDTLNESVSLGTTPLSFSPDFIVGNTFKFDYKGFKASVMSKYISRQYLTNTGFKNYVSIKDDDYTYVSMMLNAYFTTDIDLCYTLKLKGVKYITLGFTLYNIFNAKYMNNGWSAPSYKSTQEGKIIAYTNDDVYETGYAVSAPINFMAHLGIGF